MNSDPARRTIPYSHFAQLREGRDMLVSAATALESVADRLGEEFCQAVSLLTDCQGCVVVSGIGKAGHIGRKLVATLNSTGTRAQFLHPVEAIHGDLGCVESGDVAIVLSNSGESDEIARVLPLLDQQAVPVIAITADSASTLGRAAVVVVEIGRHAEAGGDGLAPTTSTTVMIGLGDALALVTSRTRGFTEVDFARSHPAGSLGRKLASVRDVMRTSDELRIARENGTVGDIFVALARPGRRTGAVILVDSAGRLVGLFTDSDLARLLEQSHEQSLVLPISELMTRNPLCLPEKATLSEAVEILSTHKVSELPVIDDDGRPVGLIDITDVIGLLPREAAG